MFATSKALTSNAKNILSKVIFKSFSQSKNGIMSGINSLNGTYGAESSKTTINNITQNISFGITQAKRVSEVSHEIVLESHLKKI